MQLGQIHSILSTRPQRVFPSDTDKNQKEQVNAITMKSGKQLEKPTAKENVKKKDLNTTKATKERDKSKGKQSTSA